MTRLSIIKPYWVPSDSEPVQTLHVAGASAALDLSILDEIGGYLLDGDYYLDCDEIDLGFRVNALGYKVLAVPRAAYYHRHPFNTQVNLGNIRKKAGRLLRLQRNKVVTFYKNLYLSEFLAFLPVILFGGPLKIMAYASRFSWPQRIVNMLGLAAFAWTGFVIAALRYFPRFATKRRFILDRRRQQKGWFLRELWSRR
jgi:GT2 family glycosyltransferase